MPQFIKAPSRKPGRVPQVGTREHRSYHISRIWTAGLWHELVMVLASAIFCGLLFYGLARVGI